MTLDQPNADFESLIAEFKHLLSLIPDSQGSLQQMVSRLETEKSRGTTLCDLRSLLLETAAKFKNELLRFSIIPSRRRFDEPRQRIDSRCAQQNQQEISDRLQASKP